MVRIEKLLDTTVRVIPLMAALPYRIALEHEPADADFEYMPALQRTIFAGRGYSTSRYDESAGVLSSKSDTQKDD